MSSSLHNQVLTAFNNMTLDKKSTYNIDPTSFLGKILTSMKNMDERNNLNALEVAHLNLQRVIDKQPNAAHNKKLTHLQLEYKEAKKNYNTMLRKYRGNR